MTSFTLWYINKQLNTTATSVYSTHNAISEGYFKPGINFGFKLDLFFLNCHFITSL